METSLPKRIFQYEILELISHGPNGEVYKGTDSTTGSVVVLKLLLPEVTDDADFKHRCRKQLNRARGVDHPNLATLHDIIEQDGRIVLVSEYVEGKSLEEVFEEKPVAASSFLDTAYKMAQGLEHLHKAELVHGNLTPSNVLITPDGRVKITDFCLPRRLTDSQPELGGFRPGMAAFASPEEARHEPPLPASDLFSLGAIYYWMLCGQPPFPGQSVTDLTRQILTHRPDYVPLDRRQIPGEIVLMLQRLLSSRDNDRCVESRELMVTLEAIAEYQREPNQPEPKRTGTQAHRVYLLVSLVAVLLVLVWSLVAKN